MTLDNRIISAEKLTKVFKIGSRSLTALDHIDLSVRQGELTAVIGPDGAGKTTLMRLICGLMDHSEGKLSVLGLDSVKDSEEIQSRISYMPQKFGLYEDLTVSENMNLYADLHGVPVERRPARFKRLLEMMGLERFTGRFAGKLSGGMKQKLGLACTLVRSPDLLLLDEPTVGVDPLSRRELWEILKEFVKEEGLSVFVSTAYMNEAEMCSHVYVLHKGHVLSDGSPEDLRNIGKGRCFGVYPEEGMPTRILQAHLLDDRDHIVDAVPRGGEVHFITKGTEPVPYLTRKNLKVTPAAPQLEDGFMILLHQAEKEMLPPSEEEKKALESGGKPSGEANIIVKDLVKKFGDFTAVAHTSFEVHKGEIFGLLGPNGAGKTTTFKMLCGLLPETGGFLSVAGVDLRKARTRARANIGYVAQKFSLYSHMTARENLEFYGGVYGLSPKRLKERIQEVSQQFYLTDRLDRKAGDLPGGYKQRLSMACALLHEPKILFLDEPTSGIDPLARRNFWRQITTLAAEGTTIIITTHFMEEAEYCDRFMIQDNGHLLAIGSSSEIREKLGKSKADMDDIFIAIVENAREKGEGA
ncbi:MAG: ATP-binding cassette domain-containing protein [Dialister sp.]|nr:ATP-binding cassette domain-containing protein [Dialister sp.]MEE3452598.1 ATP-binding cassette domain-containing protein [Dialister sp.]